MDAASPLREVFRELASGTGQQSRELASGTGQQSRELASGTVQQGSELASGTGQQGSTDPGDVLRANGHADLPEGLVAEAVVNYADTAPVEVAEHLAPYVMANSPVPVADGNIVADADPASWLEALATAPPSQAADAADPTAGLDDFDTVHTTPAGPGTAEVALDDEPGFDGGDGDFGTGSGASASPGAPASGETAAGHVEDVAADLDDLAPIHLPGPVAAPVDDGGAGGAAIDDAELVDGG